MKLDCKHVWPYISDYIDDTVTPEERRAIEQHLETCEVCSAILDSVHNILVLTADDRIFRLHERIGAELAKAAPDDGP
jgi:anti-sigma factor RsiW